MEAENLNIRPACPKDAEMLAYLTDHARTAMQSHYTMQFLNENLPPDTAQDFESLMTRREIFVAEDAGKIIGTAALKGISLGMFYVDPARQQAGVGRRLMDHILKISYQRRIPLLTVHSSLNAVGFYKSCGFSDVRPEISHAQFPAQFMERRISQEGYALLYYSPERHGSALHKLADQKDFDENNLGKSHEIFILEDNDNKDIGLLTGSYTYDIKRGLRGFCLDEIFFRNNVDKEALFILAVRQLAMQMYFRQYMVLKFRDRNLQRGAGPAFTFKGEDIGDSFILRHDNTIEDFVAGADQRGRATS